MGRREFIVRISGGMAAGGACATADRTRLHWIPHDRVREQTLHFINAFVEGLRSLGYRAGENVMVEYCFADGPLERLPALAADLNTGDLMVQIGSLLLTTILNDALRTA